jgi:hypothetical protein
MPGTSCAGLLADVSMQGARAADATRAIRPIMKILMVIAHHVKLRGAGAGGERYHTETSFAR